MFPHEVDKHIDKIGWGKKYVRVKNKRLEDVYLIIKTPDLRDRNWINFIYDDSIKQAREAGVISEDELKKELELRGIWTPTQEEQIDFLKVKLEEMDKTLTDCNEGSREWKRFNKSRGALQKKLDELVAERQERFSVCAERWAEVNRMYALVFCSALNTEEKRLWPTWKDFEAETDFDLITNITLEINNNRFISEKDLRQIARSPQWRFKWNGSKSCGALFGRPLIELDLEQQALVYWSQVYDSAYEAYERPSDDIINDDEKLDKWFEEQSKKRKEKDKKKKDEGPLGLSKRVSRHGEVFVVVGEEIRPTNGEVIKAKTIQEVAELNSPSIQSWKNRQMEKVKEKGVIKEKELRPRGDRESRGVIGATDAVVGKMRRGQNGTTRDIASRHPGGTL